MSGSSNFLSDIGKRVSIGKHYFVIEKVIAEGGYGVVFLVRDGHGRRFALKRLYVNDQSRLADCKSEIEILSLLSGYKNVIKYIDSAVNRLNTGVYEVLILTSFYPVTCTQRQEDKNAFSEREILKIFCDMCEALSVLHHCQTPIIHRDMKLENILIDGRDNYVLCDFGSATYNSYIHGQHSKSARDLEDDFHKHTTPSHRAPEIVDFYSNQNITTKIDIWALGVTLYRLCFNNLPFGESTLAIQNGHLTTPESSLYSPALHSLIYYCLDVDPEKRPDIYQVASVAFKIVGRESAVNINLNNAQVPNIGYLIDAMKKRQQTQKTSRSSSKPQADKSDWVETTTVRPRERPKANKHLQQPSAVQHASATRISPQTVPVRGECSVPVANLLDMAPQNASMTRSLDSSLTIQPFAGSSSPFGDDFSQFHPQAKVHQPNNVRPHNPSNARVKVLQPNNIPQYNHTHRHANSQQMGFEDSFADLLIQPAAAQQPQPNRLQVNDPVRGHRRYKSDSAKVLMDARRRPDTLPTKAANSVKSQPHSFDPSRVSPFEDDFSSYIPAQPATQAGTKSVGFNDTSSNHRQHQLDEFGSVPFNPSCIGTSSQNSSWNHASDRNFLPGFS